jgi:hypothetical protein
MSVHLSPTELAKGPVKLNAIFFQPTRWCRQNCKGCYVKDHANTGKHLEVDEWFRIFKYFYIGPGEAKQITISLDTPPIPDSNSEAKKALYMYHLFDLIIPEIEIYKDTNAASCNFPPEVHVTTYSLSTLKDYLGNGVDNMRRTRNLDMVSISHIDPNKTSDIDCLRELCRFTHVNYNLMTPPVVSSENIKDHLERINRIAQYVHSIYFVLHKSPIGKERSDLIQLQDKSNMRRDLTFLNTLRKFLPDDVKKKIVDDGCLRDVVDHRATRVLGCASNVSRFQVWPDGSVTGCPYAFASSSPGGRRLESVLDNIRKERDNYDFDKCHLPDVYSSCLGRQKDNGV